MAEMSRRTSSDSWKVSIRSLKSSGNRLDSSERPQTESLDFLRTYCTLNHWEYEDDRRFIAAGWGDRFFSISCRTSLLTPGWFERRIYRTIATWRNGCFGKTDDHPAHTTTNYTTLQKWMFSQKLFFKSSLPLNSSCGIQVASPKQQWRPLHSLLSYSYSLLWTKEMITVDDLQQVFPRVRTRHLGQLQLASRLQTRSCLNRMETPNLWLSFYSRTLEEEEKIWDDNSSICFRQNVPSF